MKAQVTQIKPTSSLIVEKKEVTPQAINRIISKYGWDYDTALAIMNCESRGNAGAHNFSDKTKDDSWGLFQINLYGDLAKKRPSPEWLVVPENNVAFAYELYLEDGWSSWKNSLKKCLRS